MGTIRRSVALPAELVAKATEAAPSELRDNFNLLVKEALKGYIARRQDEAFAEEMARMARDPDIRRESAAISKEFEITLSDGLA